MYAIVVVSHTAALTLGEKTMAHIQYVEFHNFDVDCSVISVEDYEVLEIMQNSDISFEDLCKAYFENNSNEEERRELISELKAISSFMELNAYEVKDWIREQRDIPVLTDVLLTVTETLARRAESRSQ